MRGPVAELRAFLDAALVRPVPGAVADPPGTPDQTTGRRRAHPGRRSGRCWRGPCGSVPGTRSSTPRRSPWLPCGLRVPSSPARCGFGRGHTRRGSTPDRPVVQSLALGSLLLAVFLAGALVVARLPVLREPVDDLLDHARYGSLPVVLAITVLNGVAEELYFRGALYAALPRHASWRSPPSSTR